MPLRLPRSLPPVTGRVSRFPTCFSPFPRSIRHSSSFSFYLCASLFLTLYPLLYSYLFLSISLERHSVSFLLFCQIDFTIIGISRDALSFKNSWSHLALAVYFLGFLRSIGKVDDPAVTRSRRSLNNSYSRLRRSWRFNFSTSLCPRCLSFVETCEFALNFQGNRVVIDFRKFCQLSISLGSLFFLLLWDSDRG